MALATLHPYEGRGQLKAEYDKQFISPARACELIRDQTCSIDNTLVDWMKRARAPALVPEESAR
jgi:hypothetical protein